MSELKGTVLLVDDDLAVGTVLMALIKQAGHQARHVPSGEKALEVLAKEPIDVVVTDIRMPGMGGMQLLTQVVAKWPDVPVIMMTAHGTVPLAVEAMKAGAADFVLKPFEREEILYAVNKALTQATTAGVSSPGGMGPGIIGESASMKEAYALIRKAAGSTATVLIRGESGTGKELAARAVHEQSPRHLGPFVKIHCAALPDTLLESELFGYEKGAFTGAAQRKPGRVELAHGGTLFLDEIGDIPLSTQVKLLRLLQERELERLGGTETLKVDVRFVAATHQPLEDLVQRKQFREDLFYRLNVVPIVLPPLRERRDDVEALAKHFVATLGATNGKPDTRLDAEALKLMTTQPWPGNVRQLQNFVERLVVLGDGPVITERDVTRELARQATSFATVMASSPESSAEKTSGTLGEKRRESEREALTEALARAGDNRTLAARLLGISRRTLYNKLEEQGLL